MQARRESCLLPKKTKIMETTEIKQEIIIHAINEGGGFGITRSKVYSQDADNPQFQYTTCGLHLNYSCPSVEEILDLLEEQENDYASQYGCDGVLYYLYGDSPSLVHNEYKVFFANDFKERIQKFPNCKRLKKIQRTVDWAECLEVSVDFLLGNE